MNQLEEKILSAVKSAVKKGYDLDVEDSLLMVETPRDPRMGDYSTNIAMRLARVLHDNPVNIAAKIAGNIELEEAESVEAVKGFINFRLSNNALGNVINKILEEKDDYGNNDSGNKERVLVEWVSANPTGDLHCGHARNAAYGDSLCRIMEASGYDVYREFYVNDAGNQVNMLGESLISRYFEYFGKEYPLPQDGYHGQDVKDIAKDIAEEEGDIWLEKEEGRLEHFKNLGIEKELKKIENDLALYRIHFDNYMHETFFYENDSKRIKDILNKMDGMGLTYEKDNALWFRSTEFGDDKDRALRKSDGSLTYLTPDIANHVYKIERGYPHLVDLWGADHHSYIVRMKCALKALGYPDDTLDVIVIQMVRMIEDGKEVKMSKRTGNALTLRELCEDIGVDAARWFFVSKDPSSHMDLDLKLARTQSNDNPVYYAQYAYSRMNSIVNNKDIPEFHKEDSYNLLTEEKELQIMKLLNEFPSVVGNAAKLKKPNLITDYIMNLVKLYHSYYNSSYVNNPDNPELTNQRLGLVYACMYTLKKALSLIGVSAPERM